MAKGSGQAGSGDGSDMGADSELRAAPKKKQEKMALGDFLTNQSLGSWADEMDAQPLPSASQAFGARDRGDRGDREERRAFTQPAWETARTGSGVGGGMSGGMGGGMGARGASYGTLNMDCTHQTLVSQTNGCIERAGYAVREQLPLPDKPPYTAHLGNLTYDVREEEIKDFFRDCEVTNVRIVEDKLDRKPKGFGYVEFGTLDGLKQALTLSESDFMGRKVKISVAEPPKERAEQSRDFSDWSRKGPLPAAEPMNQRQSSGRGFSRGNFDNMSDAGSERGGSRRPGFFEGDGKVRDFADWSRKGPLSPVPGQAPPMRDGGRLREGGGPPRERSQGPSWGEGRSEGGSRPPRKEFEPRPSVERVPTAAERDNQWRTGMKADASPAATPEASAPTSPQAQAPKERPRLNLAKRTVSNTNEGDNAAASGSDSKASPFGAAKPINTAQREREVEEKRELAVRQKKEAEEKAKEEKTAKETAQRAARAERADRGQAQEDDKVTSPSSEAPPKGRRPSRQQNGAKQAPKENGEASPAQRPSFSILSRDAEGDEEGEGEGPAIDQEDANGEIVADKEVKPQEVVRERPVGEQQGGEQNAEPTAEAMEDDGWSTVGAKPKKNNSRAGGRAIAS